jgi:uridine phosphorylase
LVGEQLRSAAIPETSERRQYHIGVAPGEVSRYVLLPGDPERTKLIASLWDEWHLVASHREHTTITGSYKGVKISTTSTGIGSPSAAIALEELLRVGADTFIRVGTMGGIHSDLKPGTLVIGTAAARLEGTSKQYVPEWYPAVAHPQVVMALIEAAELLGYSYKVGLVASTDSFYLGQGRPGYRGYYTPDAAKLIPLLASTRILGFEMESSAIFTLASIYGARAGCICAVVANRVTDEFIVNAGVKEAARTASEAVRILWEWDQALEKSGKKYFYPGVVKST